MSVYLNEAGVRAMIRALLVDDEQAEFELAREILDCVNLQEYQLDWAPSYQDGLRRTLQQDHDVYLIDYRLDDSTGIDLIREARNRGVRKPMVLMTNHGDPGLDRGAFTAGADEFVDKSIMAAGPLGAPLLDRVLFYASQRQHRQGGAAVVESTQLGAGPQLLDSAGVHDEEEAGFWDWDLQSGFVYLSPAWKQLLGFAPTEVSHSVEAWLARVHVEDREAFQDNLARLLSGQRGSPCLLEYRIRNGRGVYEDVCSRVSVIWDVQTQQPLRVMGTLVRASDAREQLSENVPS